MNAKRYVSFCKVSVVLKINVCLEVAIKLLQSQTSSNYFEKSDDGTSTFTPSTKYSEQSNADVHPDSTNVSISFPI